MHGGAGSAVSCARMTPSFPSPEQPFYNSTSFLDDLAWGAAWMAVATGEESYVQGAEAYWARFAKSREVQSFFLS